MSGKMTKEEYNAKGYAILNALRKGAGYSDEADELIDIAIDMIAYSEWHFVEDDE